MFLVSTNRILKFSWQHFSRNIWLSLATMLIIVLTLFSLTTLVLVNVIADYATTSIKETVDVSFYFDDLASEESVMILKGELEKFGEVKEVRYVSSAEALEKFKSEHKNDAAIQATLLELDKNPLGAVLIIEAQNVDQYPLIMEKVKAMKIDELVETIDYKDHQLLIGRINSFTEKIKTFGLILSAIFIFVAVLTVFNTIRMGIYVHRREIGIMRLVGANNWFIRLPFVIEGLIYAFLSCIIFWILVFALMYFFGPKINIFFSEVNFDIIEYLAANFLNIFGFELIIIAVVNVISASIAMGRYLRV